MCTSVRPHALDESTASEPAPGRVHAEETLITRVVAAQEEARDHADAELLADRVGHVPAEEHVLLLQDRVVKIGELGRQHGEVCELDPAVMQAPVERRRDVEIAAEEQVPELSFDVASTLALLRGQVILLVALAQRELVRGDQVERGDDRIERASDTDADVGEL